MGRNCNYAGWVKFAFITKVLYLLSPIAWYCLPKLILETELKIRIPNCCRYVYSFSAVNTMMNVEKTLSKQDITAPIAWYSVPETLSKSFDLKIVYFVETHFI